MLIPSSRPPCARFPDPPRTVSISSTSILASPPAKRLLQSTRIPPIDPTAARPHLLRAAPATMSSKYAFTKALKEVRFLFCQTGEHSAATRYVSSTSLHTLSAYTPQPRNPPNDDDTNRSHQPDPPLTSPRNSNFVARAYPTMKKNNPQTPILIREAAGTLPKIYARYGSLAQTEFGVEKSQSLEANTLRKRPVGQAD
ncbi:hypothetical protein CNYM01_02755 [Colletotrichum nymphaeae SA-01]|uniref:Ribosomal protein/NADH dehydrogenase domain-containing protein n=1 Tax=Colletotrichum nymphaeae SA-01 TaxID=1460502 RepID=A0A135T647_9PEZI|nr:hypothetical protein CNYM01_02755 [Colletotrichum nymphaeae SA-01]